VLFSVRDFEILRLLRWCRCVSPSDLTAVFSETEISNLIGAGLVKLHTGSASLILTGKGQQLLNEEYGSAFPTRRRPTGSPISLGVSGQPSLC